MRDLLGGTALLSQKSGSPQTTSEKSGRGETYEKEYYIPTLLN